MKLWKFSLIGLAACVLATLSGAGFVAWALGAERGAMWLFETLESRAPVELSVGGVTGTLLDGVAIADIQLAFGSVRQHDHAGRHARHGPDRTPVAGADGCAAA